MNFKPTYTTGLLLILTAYEQSMSLKVDTEMFIWGQVAHYTLLCSLLAWVSLLLIFTAYEKFFKAFAR